MRRRRPRYPHGSLDTWAAAYLAADPGLSTATLAKILGCAPGSLYQTAKLPKLAALRRKIRAGEWTTRDRLDRGALGRDDRRHNGQTFRSWGADDES
jgi:hypothetical protein